MRDHREPATVLAALPPRPGFRRPFTVRAQGWTARPDRVSDRTRRRSSTSATRTIHEHDCAILRSPARLIAAAARPACAGRGGDLPDGVGAPSATTTAGSGWRRRLLPSSDPRGSLRRASTWHQPRLHGSGAARQCRPAPRVMWRRHHEDGMALEPRANAGPDDGASPQPDPLGHLSSRDHGSTGWRARCCATPVQRPLGVLDVASPTIPPHEPCASRKREVRRAHVAPARPALAKPAGRTRRSPPLARSAHAGPVRMKVDPLAQSRQSSGAEGRFTRFSAKRTGIHRHPRCLPSTSCLARAASACAGNAQARVTTRSFRSVCHVGQGFSTGCYQPVDNTRRA